LPKLRGAGAVTSAETIAPGALPARSSPSPWHHARVSLRVIAVVAVLLAAACGSVDPDRVGATLRLPSAPDCQPSDLDAIRLSALGDFATSDGTVAVLFAGDGSSELSRFPRSTLALSARASTPTWDGFGYATVADLRVLSDLPLLPLGRSCALADIEARLPDGAAVAIVGSSSVLVAGGLDDHGVATRRLAILEVRDERVELPSPTLGNRVAFATATLAPGGTSVVVAGGASGMAGEVRDTWERVSIVDADRALFVLRAPRRDHGALALDDGSLRGVLLVGGSDGAALLDTIELVDADAGSSRMLAAHLTTPRRSPSVVRLSTSTVAIFGGTNAGGAPAGGIDLLDLASESITAASVGPGAAEWVVALPDGRLASAARAIDPDGETRMHVSIVLRDQSAAADAGTAPPIFGPVALALGSGRILVAGRDGDVHGERLAILFDPSTGTSQATSVSPVPTALVALPDGTTLALDARRASIRRDDAVTPFDSPPPLFLFADDRGALALDAASHWDVDARAGVLVALVENASIDVPILRFRDLTAELAAVGPVVLRLVDAFGEDAASVRIDVARVELGTCGIARSSLEPVRVTRRGETIELHADGASVSCAVTDLPERVGIAITAAAGAELRSLALARLP
jgi:hypothetical protein